MMKAEEFPVVLFSSQDGDVRVNAVLRDRTLWLTQKSMAGLFGVKSQAITKHLKNIYATGELQIAATCSKMEQVQSEGGRNVAREMNTRKMFERAVVGSFSDRINRIDRIMGNVGNVLNSVNPVNPV